MLSLRKDFFLNLCHLGVELHQVRIETDILLLCLLEENFSRNLLQRVAVNDAQVVL